MNKVLFDQLNGFYEPMWNKAMDVKNNLTAAGYAASLGFYNNHYVKDGKDFAIEYYPIPIITVAEISDIGIDIDTYWIEIHLDKDRAALQDYPELTRLYNLEVYGAEGFYLDFYNNQTDPYEVAEKIKNSNETLINVTFYFDFHTKTDELINVIKQFTV